MSRAGAVKGAVRQPSSAAVAGLLFSVLLIVSVSLFRSVAPDTLAHAGAWTSDADARRTVSLALDLLPFAGIAFLWFVAVVRSQLGDREDRFFETVFLGSGLVFVSALFVSAAALGAVLHITVETPVPEGVAAYAWVFASVLLGSFGMRMAAVFTLSLTTAGLRGRSLPRWIVLVSYLVGLLLLLTPPLPNLAQFLFPLWVGLISVVVLLRRHGSASAHDSDGPARDPEA